MSRRTIENHEHVVAELHKLLGILPADERPIPDLHIDKDAMYARLMAKFEAEERLAREAAARKVNRARPRLFDGWFGTQQWAVVTAAMVIVVAIVVGVNIVSAPAAVAGTPQPLSYSFLEPADVGGADNAREALVDLAGQADRAVVTAAPPGATVQYVASSGWFLEHHIDDVAVIIQPTQTESWLASDGSARLSQFRTSPLGIDGRLDSSLPSSAAGPNSSDDHPAGTLDATVVARLPRDPLHLRNALVDLAGPLNCDASPAEQAFCLVTSVRGLYARYVVPADLASAIWTVLSDEPDLKDLGTTTDRIGRPARAIALETTTDIASAVIVLLISPQDGQLIGTETVTLKDPVLGIDRPAVTEFETYTARAWVPAIGDLPGS